MIFLPILWWLAVVVRLIIATDDGLTDKVSWDKYSLKVNGERVFIFAGEFHYQRLPVPELWLDVFQKFKAHGLNAVSIYFFWSYHSSQKDVFDMTTGARNIQRLLDSAKQAGLYVIARPGPYVNAETNAGGFALWTTKGSLGRSRQNNPEYFAAWRPWVREIASILKNNQITQGGPVILNQLENELKQSVYSPTDSRTQYMEELKKAFREEGIVVPLTHNEAGMRGSPSWSTDYKNPSGVGTVNIYGLDSYPGSLGCGNKDQGFKLVRTYDQWFSNSSLNQPRYMPEFEAGWFMPWGGQFYDNCVGEHDPAFADVYYKNNIAQRVTLLTLYMAYGGTSWGHSAAPVVYTSYDYSAPLRETREIQDKFKQTKLVALFTRVSKDLLKTELEDHGEGKSVNSSAIYTWILRNPESHAGFYILQQADSRSRAKQKTSVKVKTIDGVVNISEVELNGRQSKIIVTDYKVGSTTLLFSSADILTYGLFKEPTLVMYLKAGQRGEFGLKIDSSITFKTFGAKAAFTSDEAKSSTGKTFTRYHWTQPNGQMVVKFSNGFVVLLLDTPTAWSFFAPTTTTNPNPNATDHVFVIGPYLVRDTSISENEIRITGDWNRHTDIEVFGVGHQTQVVWNGQPLKSAPTEYGSIKASIAGIENRVVYLPELTSWKTADSLPEKSRTFEDSKFMDCKTMSTSKNMAKALSLPVLYSSEYGFHAGIKIYRGYFDRNSAKSANITVQGGHASGWSAWLNGHYISSSLGHPKSSATSLVLDISKIQQYNEANVLTIVADYHGHDETSEKPAGPLNPRGILGAHLFEAVNGTTREMKFSRWKIQGNAGGEVEIDSVRGPMNEGGLYGERLGWHLPGFDTSSWQVASPLQGLNQAGIAWYVTKFDLNIDSDLDVPLGLEVDATPGTAARIQIFINGYQYGKYVPHIGPQSRFPFQPGLINNCGTNTLAISLWAQSEGGGRLSGVRLIKYGIYGTGFNFSQDWRYLQPGWTPDRQKYA